jgi:cytochrome oxidase Cu insertion factor (SCO1/SenC/PrrC family)
VGLIAWGYTHCPDSCPMTVSILSGVVTKVDSLKNKVRVPITTLDPERDDVEKFRAYVPYFHKSFLGLTGTPRDKALLLREIPLSESSVDKIADGLISRIILDLLLNEPTMAAQWYMKLTAEQVKEAFNRWIRPGDLV